MSDYVVVKAEYIETPEEARAYYGAKLRGARTITCHGRGVTVVFEKDAIHLYSVEATGAIPAAERVVRWLGKRPEVRRFSLERARLLDEVLRAISLFTVSVAGTGPKGAQNRMLHGRCLADGRYMRVVLRPGPGAAFTCVSAYPVTRDVWMNMHRSKSAKFPP